jgi:hypothetical protein
VTAGSTSIEVDLADSWAILGKLHGGYLLATIVDGILQTADRTVHPHPVAAAATYVAAPAPGLATIDVFPLKVARTFANYRATLRQNGNDCVQVLVTLGTLPPAGAAPRWVAPAAAPPSTLALADCVIPSPPRGTDRPVGVLSHIDLRLEPGSVSWTGDTASGQADLRGWARMIAEWDPVLAQFIIADAPPPATFDLGLFGWLPTLTLQVLLRQVPVPGWFRFRQHALLLAGGLLDEDCTVWSEDGSILTQARQLATYRD